MEKINKAQDRLDVLEKIKKLEEQGIFDVDVENDPPTIELKPEQIDYKRKKLKNKILRYFTFKGVEKMVKNMTKAGLFNIKEIKGVENMRLVKTGAIITCNHFSPADSFAMEITFREAKLKHKRLFRVIREGNFTNPPKGFEMVMKHCNTLPISQNLGTMRKFLKCTNELINEGNFVLIYPEESMWWNYRKPKPLKTGAYNFAVKNNVPVIPCFICMEDSQVIAPDGFPVQAFTIFVEKPIYPNLELSLKDNVEYMKNQNFEVWKTVYENFYGVKLEYDTKVTDTTDELVKKYAAKTNKNSTIKAGIKKSTKNTVKTTK